jgi:DNA-binding NtrC family response regulator
MDKLKRILVVDDDERVLLVFHDALMRLGCEFEIVTARSGRAALKKAREMPFDLIITDLRMPDVDGVALTEAIREMDTGVVVIWVTAFGCHTFRAEAARLAVYCCLDKPVEIGEIREAVCQALQVQEGDTRRWPPGSAQSSN